MVMPSLKVIDFAYCVLFFDMTLSGRPASEMGLNRVTWLLVAKLLCLV